VASDAGGIVPRLPPPAAVALACVGGDRRLLLLRVGKVVVYNYLLLIN